MFMYEMSLLAMINYEFFFSIYIHVYTQSGAPPTVRMPLVVRETAELQW